MERAFTKLARTLLMPQSGGWWCACHPPFESKCSRFWSVWQLALAAVILPTIVEKALLISWGSVSLCLWNAPRSSAFLVQPPFSLFAYSRIDWFFSAQVSFKWVQLCASVLYFFRALDTMVELGYNEPFRQVSFVKKKKKWKLIVRWTNDATTPVRIKLSSLSIRGVNFLVSATRKWCQGLVHVHFWLWMGRLYMFSTHSPRLISVPSTLSAV